MSAEYYKCFLDRKNFIRKYDYLVESLVNITIISKNAQKFSKIKLFVVESSVT